MTRHLLRAELLARSLAGLAGPRRSRAASSGFGGASESHRLGVQFASVSTQNVTPNHALQRTAPCVTAPASAAAFPPTMQVPRRTPLSLSLGSLGVWELELSNDTLGYFRTVFDISRDTSGCLRWRGERDLPAGPAAIPRRRTDFPCEVFLRHAHSVLASFQSSGSMSWSG